MHRIIVVCVVAAIVVGLMGAFAVGQLSGPANAAPPMPSPQPVREQNLDGSGSIRVHEQGTANVNVTNPSLPINGTVNVGNLPTDAQGNLRVSEALPGTKILPLADNVAIACCNPPGQFQSPSVDVSGCHKFIILTNGISTQREDVTLVSPNDVPEATVLSVQPGTSPPNEVLIQHFPITHVGTATGSQTFVAFDGYFPRLSVLFVASSAGQLSASLNCEP